MDSQAIADKIYLFVRLIVQLYSRHNGHKNGALKHIDALNHVFLVLNSYNMFYILNPISPKLLTSVAFFKFIRLWWVLDRPWSSTVAKFGFPLAVITTPTFELETNHNRIAYFLGDDPLANLQPLIA